jgi:hypothetical protein
MQIPNFDPLRVHAIELLFQNATRYVGLIAAIALIVLVLVAALRRLLSSRARYNAMSVERWIAKATPITSALGHFVAFFVPQAWSLSISDDPKDGGVLKELLVLTVGGSDNKQTLFTQTTAKMLAQIQLAANAAIDHPTRYPRLYEFLARTALTEVTGTADSDIWKEFTAKLEPSASTGPGSGETTLGGSAPIMEPPTISSNAPEEEVRAASRARSRIDNVVARKLDALQVQVDRGWESANLTVAVWIGIFIGIVLSLSDTWLGPWYFVMLILVGALSGFVGHFLGNLAAALDRVARPS